MHVFLEVTAALVATLAAAAGIAGITTGWAPRGGKRVVRPRMLGWGTLLCGVGMAVFLFLGPLDASYTVVPLIGWVAFMVGLGLQMAARSPRRTPGADATTTSS